MKSPVGRIVKNGANFEYQYFITDHLGNNRVLFTSATPTATPTTATFEDDANDQQNQFLSVNRSRIVSFTAANHTTSGIKVIQMNQVYNVGPSYGKKVYPGDKIDMEVWTYYEPTSGWSTSNLSNSVMITAVAGAFGVVSGGAGEAGKIYNGVSSAIGGFGLGVNQDDNSPTAFLNYILFDKNYKVLDMGWTAVPESANFSKQKMSIPQVTAQEAGYIFVYLSYEGESNVYVNFDDFKVTYTPTNIIQSNEYYPFGMQTANSWTRENTLGNDYLANGGTKFNATSSLYDLDFRNYDPIIGRMVQVDPMADKYGAINPYNYSFNSPVDFNDPLGDDAGDIAYGRFRPTDRYSFSSSNWAGGGDQMWVRGYVGQKHDMSGPEWMTLEVMPTLGMRQVLVLYQNWWGLRNSDGSWEKGTYTWITRQWDGDWEDQTQGGLPGDPNITSFVNPLSFNLSNVFGRYVSYVDYSESFGISDPLSLRFYDGINLKFTNIALSVRVDGQDDPKVIFKLASAFDDARFQLYSEFEGRDIFTMMSDQEAEGLFIQYLNQRLQIYFPSIETYARPGDQLMWVGDPPKSKITLIGPFYNGN